MIQCCEAKYDFSPLALSGRRGIVADCICLPAQLYLVCMITRYIFELELPNLVLALTFKVILGHFGSEFLEVWFVSATTLMNLT